MMLHFTSLSYLLAEEMQVTFGSGNIEAWGRSRLAGAWHPGPEVQHEPIENPKPAQTLQGGLD